METAATLDESGDLTIFATNRNLTEPLLLEADLRAFDQLRIEEYIVLHHDDVKAINTEMNPDTVKPYSVHDGCIDNGHLSIQLPALSWNVIRLRH